MNCWRRILRSSSWACVDVGDLLGLLDQRQHVPHAENPAGHPFRVEALQLIELLADRRVENRLAGHRLHGQRRAAAGVPIELRQQHAVELNPFRECLRHVDRVLAGHRVEHQEDVVGLGALADRRQLLHQLLVDVQASRRVDDHDVLAGGAGLAQRPIGDLDRIAFGALLIDPGSGSLAHRDQLLDGRRALRVAGHQRGPLSILDEVLGELRAGGGLARALEPGHQDHGRPRAGKGQIAAGAAHQRGQLLVDDLHHLLAGVEAVEDPGPEAALLDLGGELLHDLEVDVGLEQREADLAHRAVDIRLGQLASRANAGKGLLETIG